MSRRKSLSRWTGVCDAAYATIDGDQKIWGQMVQRASDPDPDSEAPCYVLIVHRLQDSDMEYIFNYILTDFGSYWRYVVDDMYVTDAFFMPDKIYRELLTVGAQRVLAGSAKVPENWANVLNRSFC